MRTRTRLFRLIVLSLGVLVGLFLRAVAAPPSASASGFAVYTHGAKEWGMQNNVIAHSEGPASNYHNPALITGLEGTQVEAGTTAIFPTRKFKSAETGETERTKSQVFYPSTLFVTHQLSHGFTAGLGVVNPFGLGTDWGKDWEGRYLATDSQMQTFNINPNIAWKVNDRLSVAGGFDVLLLDATLEKNINSPVVLVAAGLPPALVQDLEDGKQKFEGDGYGYGYNLGLVCRPMENWSFGAAYRSRVDVDVDGKAKFRRSKSENPLIRATLQTLFPETDGSTEITLPAQAFFGLSYQGIDKLTIELGGRWEDWSSYKELAFEFDQPIAGRKRIVYEKDWKDTWSYSIGATYDINDTFGILGGYRFDGNPVPDDTFEPAIPTSDKHCVSFGVTKRFGSLIAAASYYYEKYQSRKKNNNLGEDEGGTANGRYDTLVHIVGASVSYEF